MRIVLTLIIVSAAILVASCGQGVPSNMEDQLTRGQAIYEQGCATSTCHGVHGEGIKNGNDFRAWPLVGEAFQVRNPTAQVIFDVVRSGGEPSLRKLTDQEIFDSIAYELSLNGVPFSALLTARNAPATYSGTSVQAPGSGTLFPPPRNTTLVTDWSAPTLPVCGENGDLRWCVTQMALTESLGGRTPAKGSRFILIVSNLAVLSTPSLEVKPSDFRLASEDGQQFEPLQIKLDYPVAGFFPLTIQPEHSISGMSIFALPETSKIANLHYAPSDEQPVIVELTP